MSDEKKAHAAALRQREARKRLNGLLRTNPQYIPDWVWEELTNEARNEHTRALAKRFSTRRKFGEAGNA